ncbi:MAG: carbonic anhydrase, partial [Pyrinomonadaceae bacterium]
MSMQVVRRVIYLLTAVAFVFSATVASAQVWNHDPDSAIGPNHWGKLVFPFATCGAEENSTFVEVGKKQTPVGIVPAETVAAALPELEFQYRSTPFVVENTGHVVEVPYEPGSALRVGKEKYELLQFHFHAPSEHTVNGQFAAAELHLVHRNTLLDLAVVGVLVNVGSPVNKVIDKILLGAPIESGEEVDLGESVNAKSVLPRHSERYYYNYSGSLTTPPCSEGVRWLVLKEPVFVSQEAIDRLHEIIAEFDNYDGFPDNNRPVRPLNGRVILKSKGDR